MKHKESSIQFLELAAYGKIDEAYSKYVDPHFIHHNQYFKGDRSSLLNAMKDASIKIPNRSFKVKQVVEEGDTVMAHSQVVKDTMEIAVVHIMKFKKEKIIEMWDVGQVLSKDSPNENGAF